MVERGQKQNLDMLNGSLLDKILLFALPLAASSILQQLFNSVDVAVAGRFAGKEALAAVGNNGPVINLLITMFTGLALGANVVISRYIAREEDEKAQEAVSTVMIVAVISGFFLLALGNVVSRPLLMLIHTPEDVLDLAVLYLKIYCIGMPFFMAFNFGAAVLRSIGDTRRPMYCLIFSGIFNMGLNLLLVIRFHMGVAGVAIATVISNGISAGIVLYLLLHEETMIRLRMEKLCVRMGELRKIVSIGLPAGLQGMVFSLSNVCIQSAINGFGTAAIAGAAAAANYSIFSYYLADGFSQAAVTFTSQNYSVGKYERCHRITRLSLATAMFSNGIFSLAIILDREFFAGIFITDQEAVQYAVVRLLCVQTMEFLPAIYEVTAGALRGMGHSLIPAVISMFGVCVLRFVWIYAVLPKYPTFSMLMGVYPFTWIVTIVLMLTVYFGIWRKVNA